MKKSVCNNLIYTHIYLSKTKFNGVVLYIHRQLCNVKNFDSNEYTVYEFEWRKG